jgi:predicted acetyltransferase
MRFWENEEGITLFTPTKPYRQELGNELVLKSVAHMEDVERLAAFNGALHDDRVAAMTRALILHHPNTRPNHWLFVEDESTGQVVSSLCLIPWTWRYEDVELKAGEMGAVGTLESYRHRGLIRAQVARHSELLRQGHYDLSHIQGIPYFYRQFGYEYAIPLEGGWRVEPHLIADAPPHERPRYDFRQATLDDLPVLMRLYDEAASLLSISTVRDEASWRYLFGPSLQTETAAETWLVLDQAELPIGYFRISQHGFGEGLIVSEVSRLSSEAAMAVLRQLKAFTTARGKPYLRLNLPVGSALVQTARHRGAHDLSTYAWQIRLLDVGHLLRKLAPLLERRIAASPFAGLTQNVCLNLYREAFELRFEEGKLIEVEPLGFSNRGDVRIPPLLAAPLLLGYRSREELAQAHHDVSVRGEWQYLVDVLFPKVASFIYTIY